MAGSHRRAAPARRPDATTCRRGLVAAGIALALLAPQGVAAQAGELAPLVEKVLTQTGLSVRLSAATATSVNIDRVNGRPVCAPEARDDVLKLQRGFDAQPETRSNIGPALVVVTDPDGRKIQGDLAELRSAGVIEGCPDVYISVAE